MGGPEQGRAQQERGAGRGTAGMEHAVQWGLGR
jgi:hypothetical protein